MSGDARDYVDAVAYVQVAANWSPYKNYQTGEYEVRGARAIKLTQDSPRRPVPKTVTVKVTFRIARAAFYPLRPEAVVVVPVNLASPNVSVEAVDPHDPEDPEDRPE